MIDRKNLSDNELIQSYVNGEHTSLETLINRYKDKIFTYILITVKNQHLAEDIFQDAFIKVVRSLKAGKYIDNGKFASWVMRISHNLIIDHYRREKNMSTCSNDASDYD
ncbi:MAG TPA: sigma-70 family RNA polymerase sigma factor, partial [Prolixibacteraceae bacterium]|nr:sigma-70 family RNA polymerase sigma factor [Prolixibacteraceae bacterium]